MSVLLQNSPQRSRPKSPADWLNPRRRLYCERLINFLWWHGSKVYFDAARYYDCQRDLRCDKYAIDAAIDDLYQLGNVDLVIAGDVPVVHLLDGNLDRCSTPWRGGGR